MQIFKELYIKSNLLSEKEVKEILLEKKYKEWECINRNSDDNNYYLVFKKKECFLKNEEKDASVILFPMDSSNRIEYKFKISNIIPLKIDQLNIEEYNNILMELYIELDKTLKDLICEEKITIEITKDLINIEDVIQDEETVKALNLFTKSANIITGNKHPLDKERWYDFIIKSVENKAYFPDSSIFYRYFFEELKWPQNVASDLAVEYDNNIDLLNYYLEKKEGGSLQF